MATAKAPRFGIADGDFPHGSRSERRRERDIIFLEWVKTAPKADLLKALEDPALPRWREIALQRRLNM